MQRSAELTPAISTHALTEGDPAFASFVEFETISTHALTEGDDDEWIGGGDIWISTHALTEGDNRRC